MGRTGGLAPGSNRRGKMTIKRGKPDSKRFVLRKFLGREALAILDEHSCSKNHFVHVIVLLGGREEALSLLSSFLGHNLPIIS